MTPDVRCHRCGYTWEYTGSLQKATCPSCSAKVPVDANQPGDSLRDLADEYDLTVTQLEELLDRVGIEER